MPEELWTEVHNIVQEAVIKIPKKKKCRKVKWLSEEILQIAEVKREVKSKGDGERHTQLNSYPTECSMKNWCFWTVVLEKTFESPLDCKEIQPVHPKGDQSWMFIGRTDAKAETPLLWPPDAKSQMIGKDFDAGRDWRQKEKRMRWLNRVTDSVDMNLRKLWGIVEDSEAWCTAIHGVTHSWAWLRDSANSPRLTPRACIPELSDNRIRSLGFPGGASGKESSCRTGNAGDLVWLLCWEDPLKEGVATHSSILAGRTPTGRGAWRATVHGVAKSQIWLKWLSTHTRKSYSEGWAGLWRLWAWHFTNLTRGNEMPHEGNLQK